MTVPPRPSPRPRRSGVGWWLAGCGCLAVTGALVLGLVVLGVVVTRLPSGDGGGTPPGSAQSPQAGSTAAPGVAEQLVLFEAERERFYALAAVLDGNPVKPLVTDFDAFQRLEKRAGQPNLGSFSAQTLVQQAARQRQQLQRRIAAAEKRRVNRSGSLTEGIVDRAGDGFIDIRWDAASACGASEREGWRTSGCITKGDSLTVHLLREREFGGDWDRRMIVVHELAHIYQRADRQRYDARRGRVDRLLAKGLFQGSEEKMADCYALTYYGEWSLTRGNLEIGYGYVCGRSERRALRKWAADVDAPMPG
ncbi:hypothetical protein GUY44_01940 [Pimelobacter simplex]|uniref:hypothetical protein n=1 Tax=Nocardioides simplex TaxID=2045 RepID=UPI0005362674|nr:hypothetical protein [Pimelobacter simplex]MCG8149223.1 hypothetical protein [Pimelobacter simplex]GEB16644.1 hypothetical protein NSI01_49590 [Pimelobacter simplex]SFM21846.1 hypothetical protein SAMN05421671_0394 [Pimelobacter simplex]